MTLKGSHLGHFVNSGSEMIMEHLHLSLQIYRHNKILFLPILNCMEVGDRVARPGIVQQPWSRKGSESLYS